MPGIPLQHTYTIDGHFIDYCIVSLHANPNCAIALVKKISTRQVFRWRGTSSIAGSIFLAQNWDLLPGNNFPLRFPKRKQRALTSPSTFLTKSLFCMAIVKQYEELTFADKVYNLHIRHRQDIKALLIFMATHITWLLEKPDRIHIDCPCNDGPQWTDILATLESDIGHQFDDYAERPAFFMETFSKGKNQCFFLACIRRFRDITHRPIFKKAIQYWFDC
jgi:hypothetical protein